jgi:UDP-N-acetylglucosamine 2-epimerase
MMLHRLLKGGQSEIRSLERALAVKHRDSTRRPKKKKAKAIQRSQSNINGVLDSLKKKISLVEQAKKEKANN